MYFEEGSMMKTAIITGASSGLGREFVRQLAGFFPEISCYWLIARRADRLEELKEDLPDKTVVCMPLDLCDPMSFITFREALTEHLPEVTLLVNCAGCGYLGYVGNMDNSTQTRMVDLNVRALTVITNMTVPYMIGGSRILNVSSIASFCPTPRMTVYSSTKAYVSSFSLGLHEELRRRNITVTAVCPGPMMTEFLDIGNIAGNSKTFANLPYCEQVRVASGALQAAKAGRAVYTPKAFYKFYRLAAKLTPTKWMVKFTKV